ncbi:MAG TPA: hypothetical protein VEJ84_19455 [Acidimicrobiales bacterium]|nr:hypothetical protein [Acidimicrobiales bacterium]
MRPSAAQFLFQLGLSSRCPCRFDKEVIEQTLDGVEVPLSLARLEF